MLESRSRRRLALRPRRLALLCAPVLIWLLTGAANPLGARSQAGPVTLSIVGTTDLHGFVAPTDGRGGLALLGGYLKNLRAARAADGGAVLLLDSGDTYQGGLDSNLSEGAVVIDAYNALGYTAAAIGNHDFEYGAVDVWGATDDPGADRRGALKARAAQAHFPFLAANLQEGGRVVDWPNVKASMQVDASGVKVGVVGVMTLDALSMTLAANVGGLRVTDLTAAIETEATRLRGAGAQVVLVASHAGGECFAFDAPTDLSTCDDTAEMFDVARHLPRGLVNVMMTGHTHAGVAHEVNGVAIAQGYSWGRAFSRVDLVVDRGDGSAGDGGAARVTSVRIFPPREVCTWEDTSGRCATSGSGGSAASYEGRLVVPDPGVQAAMAPALARVTALRATPLGVRLDTGVPRGVGADESPLGNLFADALRDLAPGTDAAISYASGPGGLRADVAAGPVTVGAVYDVYPFDNLVVRRTVTGAQLRQLLTAQFRRARFGGRALGVSGISVRVECRDGVYQVETARASGQAIADGDTLVVAMSDFLAARATSVAPDAAAPHAGEAPVQMRDVVMRWLRARGGSLSAGRFGDPAQPRWAVAPAPTGTCAAP